MRLFLSLKKNSLLFSLLFGNQALALQLKDAADARNLLALTRVQSSEFHAIAKAVGVLHDRPNAKGELRMGQGEMELNRLAGGQLDGSIERKAGDTNVATAARRCAGGSG